MQLYKVETIKCPYFFIKRGYHWWNAYNGPEGKWLPVKWADGDLRKVAPFCNTNTSPLELVVVTGVGDPVSDDLPPVTSKPYLLIRVGVQYLNQKETPYFTIQLVK